MSREDEIRKDCARGFNDGFRRVILGSGTIKALAIAILMIGMIALFL